MGTLRRSLTLCGHHRAPRFGEPARSLKTEDSHTPAALPASWRTFFRRMRRASRLPVSGTPAFCCPAAGKQAGIGFGGGREAAAGYSHLHRLV